MEPPTSRLMQKRIPAWAKCLACVRPWIRARRFCINDSSALAGDAEEQGPSKTKDLQPANFREIHSSQFRRLSTDNNNNNNDDDEALCQLWSLLRGQAGVPSRGGCSRSASSTPPVSRVCWFAGWVWGCVGVGVYACAGEGALSLALSPPLPSPPLSIYLYSTSEFVCCAWLYVSDIQRLSSLSVSRAH